MSAQTRIHPVHGRRVLTRRNCSHLLRPPRAASVADIGAGFDGQTGWGSWANLILLDAERFVSLFLGHYDRLGADMRHRFPLQQVYVVAG